VFRVLGLGAFGEFLARAALPGLALAMLLPICVACAGSPASPTPPADATGQAVSTATTRSAPISIVAAENFYGDVATQIGGNRVTVVSILKDPNVDPHEYESNVDDAKAIGSAQIVIKNGLGYDAFIDKLLAASPRPNRIVIDVGQLTGHQEGDNPHVWYQLATMPKVAQKLSQTLSQLDPADAAYFNGRLQSFDASEKAVADQVAAMKAKERGMKVLPTEPVFNYMAEEIGLDVVDKEGDFQRAVENGNDPPALAVATFRQQITSHAIKALIYNSQAVTPMTSQMQDLARQNHVPVVAVSETEPEGVTYQQWMLSQLRVLQQALEQP